MSLDPDACKKLAQGLVASACEHLTTEPPELKPASNYRLARARREHWRRWHRVRSITVEWFRDPARSAKWCELAGFDWDVIVSDLNTRGLLTTVAPPTHGT